MEPPTIYLPETAIEPIERLLRAVSRLDRGRLPCTLLPARPGDEIELSREHVITVSSTCHTLPSVGYVVWDRRRKLKHEYQGLAGGIIKVAGLNRVIEGRFPGLDIYFVGIDKATPANLQFFGQDVSKILVAGRIRQ